MKIVTVAAAATLLLVGASHAQKTDQVAAGAVAGDPAASSATPDSAPTTGYGDAAESKRQRHIHLWRTGRQWKDRRGYLSAMVRAASLSCDLRIGSCPRAKALSASLSVTTIRMDRQSRAGEGRSSRDITIR
jgi:hypothetical protein